MIKHIDKTVFRFAIVGVINTLVGSGTMFILYNVFGASYWISSASNYVVGSIVSFFLNKYYTFESKKKSLGEVIRFIINISVCYALAYGIAKPAVYQILNGASKTIQDNAAMLIGMILFIVFNYFGQRFLVFRYDKRKDASTE